MKKAFLCGSIQIAFVAGALAQGTVVFENTTANGPLPGFSGPYGGSATVTVALLWAPGTSVVPQGSLTQIGTYTFSSTTGFFVDSSTITTGAATAGGTPAIFEVQFWGGSYSSAGAALASGTEYYYESFEFVNNTGNPTPPGTPPVQTTGWDGNLHLVPEPSTLALAFGGGLLLLAKYRRGKRA